MKVAVSIPDDVFADADRLAQRLNTSRSAVYARALRKFVSDNDEQSITAQINAVVDSLTEEEKEEDLRFVRRASALMVKRIDW